MSPFGDERHNNALQMIVPDALVQGQIVRHISTIHPLLTKTNKHARIRHSLRHVIHRPTGSYFSPMYNVVHGDEK
ncbi:hypothetical protein PHMEG_00010205 [Phytophthora megakarya]|uniref:Uncharacterized protein n=1 Tax=Phytophthora megakarya TaxID=4795 RepID=A0A225WEA6_9STRA|nr:hypothetical protein PHMEG_00010205 [Phytophthora megakarya]